MDQYLKANQELWDHWTAEHKKSPFYALEAFKAGKDRLHSIELSELGDVNGKKLLHLQCHFGLDTLAWARRGAIVTGVDLSPASIELAISLSREMKIPAEFVCCDIYDLPRQVPGGFDIVFTSYGVLHWLRDLPSWAKIISSFLNRDGIFYMVEDHPAFRMFTTENGQQIKLANPYFYDSVPEKVEATGSYATGDQGDSNTFYIWNHGLGEVIDSLIDAELALEYLHEFPFAARAKFPFMEQGDDGWWRLPKQYVQIPFLFSLKAHKIS